MDSRELRERYQKLLENYHSNVIDWKTFESGLFELKRVQAALASSDNDALPDTRGLEKMRRNAEQGRPNRFDEHGTELSTRHRKRSDSGLSMSTIPASSFRADTGLPVGEKSDVLRSDSTSRKANSLRLRVGNVLSRRYVLQRSLGSGTFGEAWRGKDAITENYVVIKQIPLLIRNDIQATARFLDVFQRVTVLKHQNICPVYFLEDDDQYGPFIVSAYLDAVSLEDYYIRYVQTFQTFPLTAVVRVLWPIAAALDYARDRKTCHRGLKPNNVLIGKSCGVLVTDFGLPETIRTGLLELGITPKTSDGGPWRAPEVWRDGHYSGQSDQFSLAVLAYRMIADTLPFTGRNEADLREKIINAPPPPVESESESMNAVLQQGLAKDPFDRFPSCLHFVKALIEPTAHHPHFPGRRVLDARQGLWALLFGVPRPTPPACVTSTIGPTNWPFADEETATELPDIRIPQQSVYPYSGTPMPGTGTAASVFGSLTGTTATILGGLATMVLGTGIILSTFGLSIKDAPPSDAVSPTQAVEKSPSPSVSSASESTKDANAVASVDDVAESATISADELVELTDQALKGNVDAQRKLGEMYFSGKGASTNYDMAIRYFRQSAEKGDSLSLYYLGHCSEQGLGMPMDHDLAKNYYTRAAKLGSREAKTALRRLNDDLP